MKNKVVFTPECKMTEEYRKIFVERISLAPLDILVEDRSLCQPAFPHLFIQNKRLTRTRIKLPEAELYIFRFYSTEPLRHTKLSQTHYYRGERNANFSLHVRSDPESFDEVCLVLDNPEKYKRRNRVYFDINPNQLKVENVQIPSF